MAEPCPACGTSVDDEAAFCPTCGHQLKAAAMEGEQRKVVTILFADVIGSTALGEQLDPERLRVVLGTYFAAMTEVIASWGGTVEKYVGDAVMAVFGVPTVREDDAERALHAALEMGTRLTELNADFDRAHHIMLEVRIGVNSGEVVAPTGPAPTQRIVAGDAVNVAARLEQAAAPGTVLAGERTYRAARLAFRFDPPALVEAKGKADPVRAYRLVEALPEVRRGVRGLNAPMIGRDRELATMLGTLEEAIEAGRPRLVIVYGSAGIGKSRLSAEFLATARERDPRLRVLRGRSLSAGHGITYWALAEILRGACDIALDEPVEIAAGRLHDAVIEALGALDLSEGERVQTAAALAVSIGIPVLGGAGGAPAVTAEDITRAWPRFASAYVANTPAVWLIEDLHWAGDAALEMLERIVARTTGALVLLATARPEFAESHPGFAAGAAVASSISLRPLTESQSAELVESLLTVAAVPPPLRAEILAKAEGNPFFVEEILRRLIDEEILVRDGDTWRATQQALTVSIPDSIYGLLAARVDALPAEERRVLQEAAVIGRTFWANAVEHAIGSEAAGALLGLERRGLVTVRPTSTLGGQEEYAFKHALVRDVAYSGQPKARRARAHAEAGAWIERLAGDRTDEFAELIAHHYETAVAGDDADLAWLDDAPGREAIRLRAFRALLTAGTAARRRFAIDRAAELHEGTLALATSDAERLDAYEQIGRDHDAAFHGEAALAAYTSAIDLARHDPSERARLASLARRLGSLVALRGGAFRETPDLGMVDALIAEGLEAVTEPRERAALLIAQAEMAARWEVTGGLSPMPMERRLAALDEAAKVAREVDDPSLTVTVADSLTDLHVMAGDYDLALREMEGVIPLLERIPSPRARAQAFFEASEAVLEIGGDPSGALELAEQSRLLAREMSAHDQMHASAMIMTAATSLGDWDRVEAILAEHIGNLEQEAGVRCLMVQTGPSRGALVAAERGDLERARGLIEQPRPFEARPGPIEGLRAQGLVAIGRPADGLALAQTVMREAPRWRQREAAQAALLALEALEDWPALGQLAGELSDLRAGSPVLDALGQRADGRSRLAGGDRDAGVAALRSALAAFDRMPNVFEAARTREALAEVLAAERPALLGAALSTYEQLGAAPHAARVRERLAKS
jgi:class 3 adenylate cyclase/tetratricopeptide (TPR) repeat protein